LDGELSGVDGEGGGAAVEGEVLKADTREEAEAVAAADQLNHAITIKWKQTGGKVSILQVLVDGHEVKGDFGESITLGQPRVVFGARMGVRPGPEAPWAGSELERLEYSKD
jgi:hypothetical protein